MRVFWLRRNWKQIFTVALVGVAVVVGTLAYHVYKSHEKKPVTPCEYASIILSVNTVQSVERPENIAYNVLTEYGKVPQDDIILLMDWRKDATFNNFKKAINEIAERVTENSVTTISLFGHGTGTGIRDLATFEEFDREIDKITKGKVIVLVDTCGPYTTPLNYGPCPRIVIQQAGPDEEAKGHHSCMLTNMYMALTGPDKKYTFPPYVVHIYRFADLDNNGRVSVFETFKFGENQILSYDIERGKRGARHPQLWDPENIAETTYIANILVRYQGENVGPLYHGE